MKTVSSQEVIGMVPDELLDKLADEHGVDYSVKKLQGKVIFKLFLYAILNGRNISLRILETIFNSEKFKSLFNLNSSTIKHSAIGMRLQHIDCRYFQNIFEYLVDSDMVNEVLFDRKRINIRKIDSTMVTVSSKLLKFGLDNNPGQKNLKYTVEINQGIPVNLLFFKDKDYQSEDNALPELIRRKSTKKSLNIALFDRGVQRKQTFVDLAQQDIYFISRLTCQKYVVMKDLPFDRKKTATLSIVADQIIKFQNEAKTIEQEFRLIIGVSKETGKKIHFLTNVYFLSAAEITDLYLSRWEIEIFFRFIKQELNFSHLLNRSENGIKVLMYLTMIAAILLTIYKKTNRIMGWAVAKIKFLDALESAMMRDWQREIAPLFYPKNNSFLAKTKGG